MDHVSASDAFTLHLEQDPALRANQRADEMLGEGWTKVIHPEDVAAVTVKWRHAVTQGSPFRNENRIRRHDGEWRWMRVEAVPVRSSDDNTLSWFGMHVDITERKQAEAEREKRAKIIHAEGEYAAAEQLAAAARVINSQEAGMQLRYLQTLTEISSEKNQMVVFPLPMDLVKILASALRGDVRDGTRRS